MPNSTARRTARATKPRHKQTRTNDHRARNTEPRFNPRHHEDRGTPKQHRDDNRSAGRGRHTGWSQDRNTGTRWHEPDRRQRDTDRATRAGDRGRPNGRDTWTRDDRPARSSNKRDDHRRTNHRDTRANDGHARGGDYRGSWTDDRDRNRTNRRPATTNHHDRWTNERGRNRANDRNTRRDTHNPATTDPHDTWSDQRGRNHTHHHNTRVDTHNPTTSNPHDTRPDQRTRNHTKRHSTRVDDRGPRTDRSRDQRDRRGQVDGFENRGARRTTSGTAAGARHIGAGERLSLESGAEPTSWDGEITERRAASVSFAELGLPTPLLRALDEAGIAEPFPIQAATLPDALAGRDVLGRAQTGSGKTLAFGLALLTRLHKGKPRPNHPRGLILVPTRELATQVTDALLPLAKALGLWCRTVVGGLSFTKQADQLQRGIDLLIATPGRLSDHVRQGTCVLDDVRFVALDEADQMADMGFLPQVRAILDLVPDGQRMLFSATLDRDVTTLVDEYLTDPVTHSTDPPAATVSTMDHHLLLVSREDKAAVVAEMAARDGRTIMFLRTKHHVDRLTRQLRAVGVRAGALHGGKPQGTRNRVLGEFKDGRLPVLIATDVAARGIHVDGVSLVVHVDPPADAKGYLHRAGRTARAGEAGTVVTLVTHQERRTVFRMTEQAGVRPERTKVRPGDDDLVRITGARTPSGDPVVDPEPTRRPPRPGGRFNRPGGRPRRQYR